MQRIMSVPEFFSNLLVKVEPKANEAQILASHRASVSRRLETVFATNRVEPIGSQTRDTAITRTSDLDLMLILARAEVKWGDAYKSSTTVLGNVRDQLRLRYIGTLIVRDGQAVVARFADGQHPVDVVPAWYIDSTGPDRYPVFAIPDGAGDWLRTSPQAHNRYINSADETSRGKLKRVAKLIKSWANHRPFPLPLRSFHVELLLAQSEMCNGAVSYAHCVTSIFELLAYRNCRALQDPIGISGLIKAADTEPKRQILHRSMVLAAARARKAILAEDKDKTLEAIRIWRLVFNPQ
jgi:hypothetical protein